MFFVCPIPTEAAGLLGTNSLNKRCAEINFECGAKALAVKREAPVTKSDSQGKRAALTVFSVFQVEHSIPLTVQEKLHLHEEISDVPRFETITDCGRSWLVWTTEITTVAPRCRKVATGIMEIEKGESLPSLSCVEPALKPIQTVLRARDLTRVETHTPHVQK